MAAGGFGNSCIKGLVIFFNLIFCLAGATLLGVSLWLRFDNTIQQTFEKQLSSNNIPLEVKNYYVAIYVLAAIGGLLFLTGFLGCCGAACSSSCMLAVFFGIVLVMFVAEVACGIYVLVKKDDIRNVFADGIADLIKEKYKPDSTDAETQNFIASMDSVFELKQCCGGTGCADFPKFNLKYPAKCQCDLKPTQPGCGYAIFDAAKGNWVILGGIAIGILAIELLAMIFSMVLCCNIRQSEMY